MVHHLWAKWSTKSSQVTSKLIPTCHLNFPWENWSYLETNIDLVVHNWAMHTSGKPKPKAVRADPAAATSGIQGQSTNRTYIGPPRQRPRHMRAIRARSMWFHSTVRRLQEQVVNLFPFYITGLTEAVSPVLNALWDASQVHASFGEGPSELAAAECLLINCLPCLHD